MTAEEQGLYMNLCHEVFLRDGAPIPDDERQLAKASGDHEAWGRCGKKVLRWMYRVEGGWTNKTALEILQESKRRSAKQSAYRERRGNAPGNGAGNNHLPPDPDPDPSSVSVSGSEQHPPTPLAGASGAFDPFEFAASVGNPAVSARSQRTLRRWMRGRASPVQMRKWIENGLHLDQVGQP
jgi:hypothetical protein